MQPESGAGGKIQPSGAVAPALPGEAIPILLFPIALCRRRERTHRPQMRRAASAREVQDANPGQESCGFCRVRRHAPPNITPAAPTKGMA
jgi:hypothetical protein